MGDAAEDLRDWEYRKFHRPYNEFIDGPKTRPKHKWRTLDGTVLYIEDMTTQHIINCINKLARDGKNPHPPLQQELDKRR